ncbi:MAG: hypothetical protein VKS61_08560 [Candidatus Sericytochromatia bacterium]|nr:hypothetical protein [Candidatus Sericytochromatia bacterium]
MVHHTDPAPSEGYDGVVTRRCLRCLLAWTLAWGGGGTAAFAAAPPLVLAPAEPLAVPDGWSVAADVALPTAVGWLAWRGLQAAGPALTPDAAFGGGLASGLLGGALAACVAAPPAALVALRERPFTLDVAAASATGGLLGMAAALGITRVLAPGDAGWLVTGLALGQGLGAASAFHLYRTSKGEARDLDRLPARRTDDPIDDWKFWRERRNP